MLKTAISSSPLLERIEDVSIHRFSAPVKRIHDRDDLHFFFASTAYRDLMKWLLQLNRAMIPVLVNNSPPQEHALNEPRPLSASVTRLRAVLSDLSDLIEQAPPDTGPRRFGNIAFRRWHQLAGEQSAELLRRHLDGIVPDLSQAGLVEELEAYLLASFGSAQRLDYGTGHELSFLAFLACTWKLALFDAGEERAIVIGLIQPYLDLVRKLILTYTLEPAGSHGVWGLDDHSFVPYIFGSAQLAPAIPDGDLSYPVPTEGSLASAPSPSSVTKPALVGDYKDTNMYFSAIQFIYDVKKGPFWEHSPVLYDISGIKDGWGKINKGMLKMYAAEVLGKFPVVQHFRFGSLFAWERDPEAPAPGPSVHSQQQPVAGQSKDVPQAPCAATATTMTTATAAPWAKAGASSSWSQMQSQTGVPSVRAPWAASDVGIGGRPSGSSSSNAAPSSRRAPPSQVGMGGSTSDATGGPTS